MLVLEVTPNHYLLSFQSLLYPVLGMGLLSLITLVQAQPDTPVAFDRRMKQLKTAQGKVLAFWAGINLLSGGILIFTTEQWFYYFHAMNVSWGLVNTGVAAFIYFHHNQVFNRPQTLLEQMSRQRHAENMIFLKYSDETLSVFPRMSRCEFRGLPNSRM